MNCKQCSTELRDNAKFCHACGTKIEISITCIQCSLILNAEDKFCYNCGTIVNKTPSHSPALTHGLQINKLHSVEIANQGRSWVNEDGEYIYFIKNKSIWKMKENLSDLQPVYKGEDNLSELGINTYGVYVIANHNTLLHISFTGEILHTIQNVSNCYYVYKDELYYVKSNDDYTVATVHCFHLFENKHTLIKTLKYNGSDGDYVNILNICANDCYIVLNVSGYDSERSNTWLLLDRQEKKVFTLDYKYKNSDGDISYLEVYYVNIHKNLVYTSLREDEGKYYCVMERKLGEKNNMTGYKQLVSKKHPKYYYDENFGRFYTFEKQNYYDVNEIYGFTYGHKGKYVSEKDHYYNLYKISKDLKVTYLKAGSRGGIEELNVVGNYVYFDSQYVLRAHKEGHGMESLAEILK